LEAERNCLEEVIQELNLTWTRTLGVRLELMRWETHAYPGVGTDPQDVINRQLPNDYDIFIGLMWARFGTSTGRAGSGTEEEFVRALSRFRTDPNSVRIMFYFKDTPLSPSSLDVTQIGKIQKFRESLGKEGVLYWPFITLEEFEKLLRLHLARQVQELVATGKSPKGTLTGPQAVMHAATPSRSNEEEEDAGYLDLLDALDQVSSELAQTMTRMTNETNELTRKTTEATAEINSAVQHSARNSLAGLSSVMRAAHENTIVFRMTISQLPRLTSELNRAKRETIEVLDEVSNTISSGSRVIQEGVKTIDGVLTPTVGYSPLPNLP
jgi:hypothetical protein